MQDGDNLRAVVADDHPLYREGVVRALAYSGEVEVVGQASDGRTALEVIQATRPDIAVLDYRLPGLDGVQVAHAIVRDHLPTRVLLLSAFTESGVVYKALQTGVTGVLPKEARNDEIVEAVIACARGENVLPSAMVQGLLAEIRMRATSDAPALSEREREVLRLVAAGRSVPQIARDLFLGATTVKTHLQHVYDKLGVSDRAAAVAEALRRGVIE